MAIVTNHAAARYVERVDPRLTPDQARAEMLGAAHAIDIACVFGAKMVKMGNGARLVLEGEVVVTVKQSIHPERAPASKVMLKRFNKNRRARQEREA